MRKIKKLVLFMTVMILVAMLGITTAYAKSPKGKIFYTTANMWYEHDKNFLSTNFHLGHMIPAGTKVRILRYGGGKIGFKEEANGRRYTYIHARKHSRIKLKELFNRYFSEKNVMTSSGAFSKFTKEETKNIKDGIIAPGMSKDAVLMAYGYPPTHKTRDLSSDLWTYWKDRAGKLLVHFENDVVTNIQK